MASSQIDPVAVVVAVAAGLLSIPVLQVRWYAGIVVAVVVYYALLVLVKGAWRQRQQAGPEPVPARPRYGTPAADWLSRAEDAMRHLRDLARPPGDGVARLAARDACTQAEAIFQEMRRLGGQAAAIGKALQHIDTPDLDAERERLATLSDPSSRVSLKAAEDRIAVRNRLQIAADLVDARLQLAALGLEGLDVHVSELLATDGLMGPGDLSLGDLEGLTADLEGIRAALADAEQLAKTALGD